MTDIPNDMPDFDVLADDDDENDWDRDRDGGMVDHQGADDDVLTEVWKG